MDIHQFRIIDTLPGPEKARKHPAVLFPLVCILAIGLFLGHNLFHPGANPRDAFFEHGNLGIALEVVGAAFELFQVFSGRTQRFFHGVFVHGRVLILVFRICKLGRLVSFSGLGASRGDGGTVEAKAGSDGHVGNDGLLFVSESPLFFVFAYQPAYH